MPEVAASLGGRQRECLDVRLKLRIDQAVLSALVLTCIMTFAMLGVTIQISYRVARDSEAAVRSLENTLLLERLVGLMTNIETGVRGFMLTDDETYLAPYTNAKAELPDLLRDIDHITGTEESSKNSAQPNPPGTPDQIALYGEIQKRITEILKLREKQVNAIKNGEHQNYTMLNFMAPAKRMMDELRHLVDNCHEIERLRGEQVRNSAHTRAFWLAISLATLSILTTLFFALVYLAFRRDLAGRKHATDALREAEARLVYVLDHCPAIIYMKDTDHRFTFINRTWGELFKLTLNQVRGKLEDDVLSKTIADSSRRDESTVFTTASLVSGVEQICVGEQILSLMIHRFPLRDTHGEIYGVCGIAFDISTLKNTEVALSDAKGQAEKASLAKSEFLGRMSHELRTPLNSILGFAQLLRVSSEVPEHQEYTNLILRSGQHLLGLINEVLDISRIEAGKIALSPEPVSVTTCVESVRSLVRPMADERGIKLTMNFNQEENIYVQADHQRLNQVLLNIVNNAVKYNRQNGDISISISLPRRNVVRISVSDTGPGIPEEFAHKLFTPFERLNAEPNSEGTGLGLALSKGLLNAMGGELGYFNNPDGGATFWFDLEQAKCYAPPVDDQDDKTASGAPRDETGSTGTLLYIEDNPANFTLVERLLARRTTCRFIGAVQGRMGLDLCRQHRPSLVLLDLNLPDISGEEVLLRLRAEPETRDIPVVILTADASNSQRARLLAAGADDYITKPFDLAQFLAVVAHYMPKNGGATDARS